MQEARLIFPAGKIVCDYFTRISKEFGGLTAYSGVGYWKENETEIVNIVDVAYEPSFENDVKLYDIAQDFRVDAKQEAVYLRYGSGRVQMVTEKSCMDNGKLEEPFDWEKLRLELHKPADDENDVIEHAEHVALI